jgi:hypothetical protein
MQNCIEDAYMQASKETVVLTTVIKQHIQVIEMLEQAEDRLCIDLDQYTALKTELSQINASLHTLVEMTP